MRSLASIFSIVFLTIGEPAFGCTLAPNYLSQEFGASGVKLGNIVKRADKIISGNFEDSKTKNGIRFHVTKSFKPKRKFFFRRSETVLFPAVKQHFIFPGREENAFGSVEEVLEFARRLDAHPNTTSKLQYGVGGPIAGIFHGSDCERFVMVKSEQNYLIFLDDENFLGDIGASLQVIDDALMELSQ